MTDMPGITSNTARTAAASTTASAPSVDYGAFLQLLVAQLKNQDPSKPMDSTQYMAQLASFSQVEQSMMTNSKLDSLLTSSAIEQANQLIGHTLTSADGELSGKVVSVKITSDGLVAKLDNGKEMSVGPGVIIS
jgi:flagellar basal-body rod modification protein FlgD